MTNDVHVYELDIPGPTREMVTENSDGTYSVFLNSRLSYDEQRKGYEHAMYHINHNDFEKDDVQKIETEAHQFDNLYSSSET